MMTSLIYKYLNNKATEKEVLAVFNWIEESEENKKNFIALKKLWALTSNSKRKNIYQWNTIKNQLFKSPKNKPLTYLKYAVGFLFVITLFILNPFENEEIKIVANQITLQTTSGKKEVLLENSTKFIEDNSGRVVAKHNDKEIIYYKQNEPNKITYNTIKVPYSKTFKISLSDGTIIHLNAGSSLTYPEQFKAGEKRIVTLEGEALFNVAKDKSSPFIVRANQIDVEVLGTKFNVSSYLEDGFTSCVLEEGAVMLKEQGNSEKTLFLKPNEKCIWSFSEKEFSKDEVNTKYYTSWVDGELVFKNTPFSVISKKIERYYDVSFVNKNPFLAKQNFTGTIKVKESTVEDILDLFKIDTQFEYEKKEKSYQILKP